jgi:hypothetical protein
MYSLDLKRKKKRIISCIPKQRLCGIEEKASGIKNVPLCNDKTLEDLIFLVLVVCI